MTLKKVIQVVALTVISLSSAGLAADDLSTIQDLLVHPQMREALDTIVKSEHQNEEDLVRLTEIAAPTFMEAARAKAFANMLLSSGATDVDIDAVGNVIAKIEGHIGARTIAVVAHLDTVFPADTPIKVKREGRRFSAPGVGDNTRGLVMVNAIMKAIHAAKIKFDANVLLIGTVAEEGLGDLRGVKHLFREGAPHIDSFIGIDGSSPERIVTSAVGSIRYRVTFSGPGGHSWRLFGRGNPLHALGRAIALLDEMAPSVTGAGDKSSYNVGRVGGGTSINSIPYEAWMEVDLRSGDKGKLEQLNEVFLDAVTRSLETENAGREHGAALSVDISKVGERPAGKGDTNSSLVQNALAIHDLFGYSAVLSEGSTDANIPIFKGIPSVTISRGGKGGEAHTLSEWWENDRGYEAIQIALLLLTAEAGLARTNDDS